MEGLPSGVDGADIVNTSDRDCQLNRPGQV
jgi:hypothetical protein